MKYIYLIFLFFALSTSILKAQNFKATLDNTNQDLEILLTPDSELTIGFSTFEFFIRLSNADAAKVASVTVTPDGGNFPDFTASGDMTFVGTNTQATEAGFTHYHFSWQAFDTEISSTYNAGTPYRAATVRLNAESGMETETVVAELVHNDFFSPSYISLFGGSADRFDYTGTTADSVFDDVLTEDQSNGDGSTTFIAKQESVALPINLKSFTAIPFQNRDANLDWTTASEINGSHFEVERSDDGINFVQIGRVEATGNTDVDQTYKYSDRDVNMERNDVVQYYRIKMVDLDGEFKYSGVRVVNFTRSNIDFSINAYPNPTTDFVQLELMGLDNTSTERPTLRILNNTGQLIRSQVLDSDLGNIDMSDLPGNVYHFMIDYKRDF